MFIPKECYDELATSYDLNTVKDKTTAPHALPPPGGCFFINKAKFIKAGMENENMIAYGPEDQERLLRVTKLGYRVARLPGILYHMDHLKVDSSAEKHDFSEQNKKEFQRIQTLNLVQLQYYVGTWSWIQ